MGIFDNRDDKQKLYSDPAFAAQIQKMTGATNPYNVNSSNKEERKRALSWFDQQSEYLDSGMPQRPGFESNLNPDGSIKDVYHLDPKTVNVKDLTSQLTGNLGSVNLDKTALSEIQNRALSNDPSAWLKLQLENQDKAKVDALNNASKTAAQGYGNAYSQLAQRGGLTSGARERLARSSSESADMMGQNVQNQDSQSRLNLQMADRQSKDDMLKQLPGMQLSASGFDLNKQNNINSAMTGQQSLQYQNDTNNATAANQANTFNIQNALSDTLQKRAYDANQYNEQMKAWGADETAKDSPSGKK
jgi:hypothetical protein